MVKGKKGFN